MNTVYMLYFPFAWNFRLRDLRVRLLLSNILICRLRSSDCGSKQKCHKSKTSIFTSGILFFFIFNINSCFWLGNAVSINCACIYSLKRTAWQYPYKRTFYCDWMHVCDRKEHIVSSDSCIYLVEMHTIRHAVCYLYTTISSQCHDGGAVHNDAVVLCFLI